jgi:D-amino-acid oxidase
LWTPVVVAPERVRKVLVGLRPYRQGGFRLETERWRGKHVVHNYGHGGAGISLAPGTAEYVVRFLEAVSPSACAVIGAGIVGLMTAIRLQQAGWSVRIYARDLPRNTTSHVAGGLWFPTLAAEESTVPGAIRERFEDIARISHAWYSNRISPDNGIGWIRHYMPGVTTAILPGGNGLYRNVGQDASAALSMGFADVLRCDTLMVEPPVFLPLLLDAFLGAGGELDQVSFDRPADLEALPEGVLINCSGLGARTLFDDSALVSVRGHILMLPPQPEVKYAYVIEEAGNLLYLFPRRDAIILGGSAEYGVESRIPEPLEIDRILSGHRTIMERMRDG